MNLDQDVRTAIAQAQTNGDRLVLVGQMDRRVYERTNKALEAAGGVWNRKAKAHIFPGDASAAIATMLETGSIVIPRDEFEFFETPQPVLDIIMGELGPCAGMLALEPEAGDGAIVRRMATDGAVVDCVEIQPAKAAALSGIAGVRQVHTADFLSCMPVREYDAIAMNPPFAKQADIKHVLHALEFLKPEGLLVSVMAAGVTFRQDRRAQEFRALVASRNGSIVELPDLSFRASGTDINTVYALIPWH